MENNIQSDPKIKKYFVNIYEPFDIVQHLHTSEEILKVKRLQLSVFSCSKYKPKGKRTKTYKIMAGLDKSSVILIEPTKYNDELHLVPVELIENLHRDYVLHFEDWF